MKKYLVIYKATFIESLQYIMSILLGFVTYFMILFVFMNLWRYIYQDSSNLIEGYSLAQMIWYVILTETIWFGTRNRTLTAQINNDIKSGTIAYGINKPYHYLWYIISKHLGEVTLKFILFLIAGIIIGYGFIGGIPGFQLYQLPVALLSLFLGILINSFLRMGISVLSFWIEDSAPFQWIYDKLLIIVGIVFPVEMFPLWVQPFIKCTPIYVITYGPAKLVIDFSPEMCIQVFFAQGIYLLISMILLFAFFRKGVKKLNVNGG